MQMSIEKYIKKNNKGFTLIELMMGALILAMIGTLCYGALWGTFKTQKTIAGRSDIQELGTSLINKIRMDMAQTFYVKSRRPLTRFKSENLGKLDKITFTALVHIPTQENAHESDQALITYETEPDPENPQNNILKRRETPIIAPTDDAELAQGDFVKVTNKIQEFDLQFYDGLKYQPEWDIESQVTQNKLPSLIKIRLVLQDDKEVNHVFFTTLDLPMSQSLGTPNTKTSTRTQTGSGNSSAPNLTGNPGSAGGRINATQ